jgi:hypothetical protein
VRAWHRIDCEAGPGQRERQDWAVVVGQITEAVDGAALSTAPSIADDTSKTGDSSAASDRSGRVLGLGRRSSATASSGES